MTTDEAIKYLKNEANYQMCKGEYELENALGLAIEALKKQKPVKPIETWYDSFVCPICNGFTTCQKWKNGNPYNAEFEYCPTCGQKLDQEVE